MKSKFPAPLPLNMIHILNFFIWLTNWRSVCFELKLNTARSRMLVPLTPRQVHSTKYQQDDSAQEQDLFCQANCQTALLKCLCQGETTSSISTYFYIIENWTHRYLKLYMYATDNIMLFHSDSEFAIIELNTYGKVFLNAYQYLIFEERLVNVA